MGTCVFSPQDPHPCDFPSTVRKALSLAMAVGSCVPSGPWNTTHVWFLGALQCLFEHPVDFQLGPQWV